MLDTRTIQAQQRPTRTLWLIGTFASLIGFGQNALLVSLPILVMTTDIDLGTWSILIAIGSVLFLPSAPFWGKQSDKSGPRKVVSIGLLGLAVTFIGFALIIHALEQSLDFNNDKYFVIGYIENNLWFDGVRISSGQSTLGNTNCWERKSVECDYLCQRRT
ncbi:MFS transporter [Vibrio mediterranei]|uniref:MFS transporter n=1 Tax=Vibrio mediterranei TaxID=689 RepID=UPI0038CE2B79